MRYRGLVLSIVLLAITALAGAEVLQEITVKDGDTLWGVANYYLKDPQRWPEILKHNKLPSTDLNVILPGMRLRVPMLLIKEHLRAAHLIYILNDVRYRRKTDAEWRSAAVDMELFNEDGLRTLQESRARVKFPSGETLAMDENSLIILKPETKQEEIDLIAGGVRASKTRILASDTVVDPKIEPRGPNPDFRTKVKEDKTTLVEVYEGIVDVTAQGKTVTLSKGFGTEVKFRQAPSLPRALPPMPNIALKPMGNAPAAGRAKVTAASPGLTIAAPEPVPGKDALGNAGSDKDKGDSKVIGRIVTSYRVQISTTYAFTSVLLDETRPFGEKTDVDLKKRNLPDGVYFYRVAYLDELGFEGQFSSPVEVDVDTHAPLIEVASPVDDTEFDTEFLSVEGTTERGSSLTINGKPVSLDDTGKFMTALTPSKGKNTLKLTAVDKAGNRAEKDLTVYQVKKARAGKRPEASSKIGEKSSALASIALATLTIVVIIGVIILIVK